MFVIDYLFFTNTTRPQSTPIQHIIKHRDCHNHFLFFVQNTRSRLNGTGINGYKN